MMNDRAFRRKPFIVLLIVGLFLPFLFPNYQIQLTELWLLMVFALGWDITGGQTGYNSFGNILFIGVGMYVCVVTQVMLFYSLAAYTDARGGSVDFLFSASDVAVGLAVGLPLAGIAAAGLALLFGRFFLQMRGHYFAICTLGVGIAAGEIISGIDILGGGAGLTVPYGQTELLGDTNRVLYYLAFALAMAMIFLLSQLYRTNFGLALNAIRDNEDKAEAMGLGTTGLKVAGWAIAAFSIGIAGGLLGNLKRFVHPIDVAFSGATYGVWMILIAILGGKGSIWGAVIGAVVFQVLKELFWTYLFGWQRVALGVTIVVIIVFFPKGIDGWLRRRQQRTLQQEVVS